MPDARHITPCSCVGTCGVAIFTEWEGNTDRPDEWFVEFYEHISRQPQWRDRLRVVWGVLRGREPYTHGVCLQAEEIAALRDFLNERAGSS